MTIISNLKQYSTSSIGLMTIGIFSTLVIAVGYKVFLKPEFERKHRQEAEAVADYIFQRELQHTSKENEIY
ncbi:uncharacterized protein LOC142225691 isoform X1 [Haematobia irritans]|uniref:Uncharacterized protein n=1 Tax=Haematobia irritans TaxID=7368 RepID=A0A1L8EEC6_HAEIR